MPNATNITEYVESAADDNKLLEVLIASATINGQEEGSNEDETGENIIYNEPASSFKNNAQTEQRKDIFNTTVMYIGENIGKSIYQYYLEKGHNKKK